MRYLRALFMAVLLLATWTYAQQSPCPIPQSPRNVDTRPKQGVEYNFVSTKPLITDPAEPETIKYQGQTLYRCDQHYHVPVENTQGCQNERKGNPAEHGALPPDQWIEVHTVYAAGRDSKPECHDYLDHDLKCCTREPFVVRGFSAKVTSVSGKLEGSDKLIIPPVGTLFAEWSGSNTGPDKPEEHGCKPIRATWSFLMGCDFTINQSQLVGHSHGARPVQTGDRVSKDLTLAGADSTELDKRTCRWIDAGRIRNDEEAKKECPKKCSVQAPLTRWSGLWQTRPDETSQCSCCPPLRP